MANGKNIFTLTHHISIDMMSESENERILGKCRAMCEGTLCGQASVNTRVCMHMAACVPRVRSDHLRM